MEARIKASQDLQSERVQQVKLGSALEQELIESRAQFLQAKQELLSTDLQLSDLKLKLNDLMGLPLTTALALDPAITEYQEMCRREECVAAATASHPEISASHGEVEKAEAAVRLAKVDIRVTDVEAFARYSYQNQVPFLARNFGTFGVHFGYDIFDAGVSAPCCGYVRRSCRRQKRTLRESPTRLSSQYRQRTTSWNGPSRCRRYPRN